MKICCFVSVKIIFPRTIFILKILRKTELSFERKLQKPLPWQLLKIVGLENRRRQAAAKLSLITFAPILLVINFCTSHCCCLPQS
jgi:hypothetical protein